MARTHSCMVPQHSAQLAGCRCVYSFRVLHRVAARDGTCCVAAASVARLLVRSPLLGF